MGDESAVTFACGDSLVSTMMECSHDGEVSTSELSATVAPKSVRFDVKEPQGDAERIVNDVSANVLRRSSDGDLTAPGPRFPLLRWDSASLALVAVGAALAVVLTNVLFGPHPVNVRNLTGVAARSPVVAEGRGVPVEPGPVGTFLLPPGARPPDGAPAPAGLGAGPRPSPSGHSAPTTDPGRSDGFTPGPDAGPAPAVLDGFANNTPEGPDAPATTDPPAPDPDPAPTTAPVAPVPPPTDAGAPAPRCLGLAGPGSVVEGSQAAYHLLLDRALPVDAIYRVSVVPGTAHWVGNRPGLAAQDIMWGGYYTTWAFAGFGWVGTGRVEGRVGQSTGGVSPVYSDRPMVGPADASWDWSLLAGGAVRTDPWVDVTVPAGSLSSGDVTVQAWREQVTVDWKGDRTGYPEPSEQFGLSGPGCSVAVTVLDLSTYTTLNTNVS